MSQTQTSTKSEEEIKKEKKAQEALEKKAQEKKAQEAQKKFDELKELFQKIRTNKIEYTNSNGNNSLTNLFGNTNDYIDKNRFYNSNGFVKKNFGYAPYYHLNDTSKLLYYMKEPFINKKFSDWYAGLISDMLMIKVSVDDKMTAFESDYDLFIEIRKIIEKLILFDPYILSSHMLSINESPSIIKPELYNDSKKEDIYKYYNKVNQTINELSNGTIFKLKTVKLEIGEDIKLKYSSTNDFIKDKELVTSDNNNARLYNIAIQIHDIFSDGLELNKESLKKSKVSLTDFKRVFSGLCDILPSLNNETGGDSSDSSNVEMKEAKDKAYQNDKLVSDIILKEYKMLAVQLEASKDFTSGDKKAKWESFSSHIKDMEESTSSTIYIKHKNQWAYWNSFHNALFTIFGNVTVVREDGRKANAGKERIFVCLQLILCNKREIDDIYDGIYLPIKAMINEGYNVKNSYVSILLYLLNYRYISTNPMLMPDPTLFYDPKYYKKISELMLFTVAIYSENPSQELALIEKWDKRETYDVPIYTKLMFIPNVDVKEDYIHNYMDFMMNIAPFQYEMYEYQLMQTYAALAERITEEKQKEKNISRTNPWEISISKRTDRVLQEESIREAFNNIIRTAKSEVYIIDIVEKELKTTLIKYFPGIEPSSIENITLDILTLYSADGGAKTEKANIKDLSAKLTMLISKVTGIGKKLNVHMETTSKNEAHERFKQLLAMQFKKMVGDNMKEFSEAKTYGKLKDTDTNASLIEVGEEDTPDEKKSKKAKIKEVKETPPKTGSTTPWLKALSNYQFQALMPLAKSAIIFSIVSVMTQFVSKYFSNIEAQYNNVLEDIMLRSVMMGIQNPISKEDEEVRLMIDDFLRTFSELTVNIGALNNKFKYSTDKNEDVVMIVPKITMKQIDSYDENIKRRRTPINDTNYENIDNYLPYAMPDKKK